MSLVSSSVDAAAYVTTFNYASTHKKNETSSQAINIGNLNEENTTISISDDGAQGVAAVSQSFTTEAGGTVTLSTNLFSQEDLGGVGAATTHFQLLDSNGDIIADSEGSDAQIQAFNQWKAGTLAVDQGTYTAIATPDDPSAGATGSLSISSSLQQGTKLGVNSQLTGSDQTEYYNYSFSGTNMKLDFNATTNANQARVIVYNSAGAVVADSQGNPYEKANYNALTSNLGLTASSDTYTVEVTYANTADPTTQNINYNLNLYSGDSYSVIYNNNDTAQPTDNTAAGSVTASSDAQLYSTTKYNKINAKPSDAINIGWMQENKAYLDVYSQLTNADSADYYSFTLQSGNNLKFGFNSSTTQNVAGLRVQLMNSTGTQVIADNEGTAAQQAAYKELTTTNGLTAKTGTYMVKISYANNAQQVNNAYEFGIYSGTSYSSEYKTTASAETYQTAITAGQITGLSSATAIAAYLTSQANGSTTNSLIAALQSKV